jgi:hypothetical protein
MLKELVVTHYKAKMSGEHNNNSSKQPSPKSSKLLGQGTANKIEVVSDDDENVIVVKTPERCTREKAGDPETKLAINDYVYNPSVIDTSVICDFGFRNLENVSNLSKSELNQLREHDFEKLSLSHNALRKIPNNFFSKFPKLQLLLVLDLSCNQLKFLPNDIDHLVNLTHLNLFLNKLRCLPPSVGRLTQLQWLNLARNPELFKSSYLKTLAGPMLTEEECRQCAFNVKQWINLINESRGSDYLLETYTTGRSRIINSAQKGPDLGMDEHLVRYYPDASGGPGENTSDEDLLRNQMEAAKYGKLWQGLQWAFTTFVGLFISLVAFSVFIAPFVMNEDSRKYFTSVALLSLPQFFVDITVPLGKLFHDVLWGLPCLIFLREDCTYCHPKPPTLWDLVVHHWLGMEAS